MHFFSKKCSISYILSSTNMYKKIVKTCHAKMLIPNQQLGGDDAKCTTNKSISTTFKISVPH